MRTLLDRVGMARLIFVSRLYLRGFDRLALCTPGAPSALGIELSVAKITNRGWYGIGSPFSLRVVDTLAMFPEMASIRIFCAVKALVLMSSAGNMAEFGVR